MCVTVRCGTPQDADACQRIARANTGVFGFIRRVWLEQAATKQRLLVAEEDGQIVGFAHWNPTKYGPHASLYEIAVTPERHGRGIGSALLAALKQQAWEHERNAIVLRCPTGLPANDWYLRRGLQLLGQRDADGKRAVNLWRLAIGGREG